MYVSTTTTTNNNIINKVIEIIGINKKIINKVLFQVALSSWKCDLMCTGWVCHRAQECAALLCALQAPGHSRTTLSTLGCHHNEAAAVVAPLPGHLDSHFTYTQQEGSEFCLSSKMFTTVHEECNQRLRVNIQYTQLACYHEKMEVSWEECPGQIQAALCLPSPHVPPPPTIRPGDTGLSVWVYNASSKARTGEPCAYVQCPSKWWTQVRHKRKNTEGHASYSGRRGYSVYLFCPRSAVCVC